MARLTELTREQFNEFKKVKHLSSPLTGEYCLYNRKGNKYLAKHLSSPFTSTRTASIPYYVTENRQKLFFFEQEGQSMEGILEHKTTCNRLNSKHNNSQLICWMTKYKSFEMNLWQIFKLGVKVITSSPTPIHLGCLRVVKLKLVYHYESWLTLPQVIVRDSIQELQKYYFSQAALKNIRDSQSMLPTEREALFRLAFLILHVGTRDLNLRFYEYGMYQISQENMVRRIELFVKRYPRLGEKIQHILLEMPDHQEYKFLEELSSINVDGTLLKNLYASSVDESKSNPRKSIQQSVKSNNIFIMDSCKPRNQKLKTQECKAFQFQCSPFNVLERIKSISWEALLEANESPLVQKLNLQDYYPITTYEQKLMRLLSKIFLKIIYSKKDYSNNSVYLGQLSGQSREGKGLYIFDSGDVYFGDWVQNNLDGSGTYIFKNGDSYEGELHKGLKHGHGRNQYASGSTYQGSWIENHKKGLATVYYKNGNMFIGEFFGNQKVAQGIYVGPDGVPIQTLSDQENCKPPQTLNKPGKGPSSQKQNLPQTLSFPEGEYTGETIDGMRWGYGQLRSSNSVYQGNWKQDLKHGEGRLKGNGYQLQGIWEDNFIIEYK